MSLPAATLAWITSLPGVTTVIPGARSVAQAEANAQAASLLDLGEFDAAVRRIYDALLRTSVHPQW